MKRQLGLGLLFLVACSSTKDAVGTKVTTTPSAGRQEEIGVVQAKLAAVKDLDATGFASKYALPFTTALGYEPLKAGGYDLVKGSAFAPTPAEESVLAKDGFLVTDRTHFPSFVYGYQSVYRDDLPVFISADSILYAVHKSFDAILKQIEGSTLAPTLQTLITEMRSALRAGAANDLPANARTDADVFLAVAASLLSDTVAAPVAGGDAATINALVAKAKAASGSANVDLFGKGRDVDFSQFEPRGHYTDSVALGQYFRATMWFGRIEFRIIETQPDHSQVFLRRQLDGAFVLRALMNETTLASWKKIDDLISGFIGEHDNMTVPQLDNLLSDLHVAKAAELAGKSDGDIAQAIVAGNYGGQRVSSQIMINGLSAGTMPLSHTFLLLGQRYTLDSHVFSNVVYDRVQHGDQLRMMPNPLDVAFAAMGNNQAGLLLGDEIAKYKYASDLASMRVLADEHPAEYWDGNLYNQWESMLRTLSPKPETVANPNAVGMPKLTGTDAWGRRILSGQLASWAELRHDTILYAKQSYTGGNACEYPDAYVEPYPELFTRLAAFATKGAALTAGLPATYPGAPTYGAYFEQLRSVAGTLEAMAKNQRTGAPHTKEQLEFVNKLVFKEVGCGQLTYDGWYSKLFYAPDESIEQGAIVADVHTQPFDPGGIEVGKVLHVGTWLPRTMIMTVESCNGPRAYVGIVSGYHEHITEKYQRLNDQDWTQQNYTTPPAEVPWFSGYVSH